jgi:hypothetical protein
MANSNIFLKYDSAAGLTFSTTETGTYEKVTKDNPTTQVNGGDTITFKAVSGIDKIQKIDDGVDGTPKLIKSKKGEDSNTVVATIIDKTVKGEISKYNIKFKPEGGGQPITVDPQMQGNQKP